MQLGLLRQEQKQSMHERRKTKLPRDTCYTWLVLEISTFLYL